MTMKIYQYQILCYMLVSFFLSVLDFLDRFLVPEVGVVPEAPPPSEVDCVDAFGFFRVSPCPLPFEAVGGFAFPLSL